jgi:hypothetical protein
MQCGAPAARRRRLEKIPGRNRMGLVALNDSVPGGRAPQPPSPHPADRPRSSAKCRSLFVATATPSQRVCHSVVASAQRPALRVTTTGVVAVVIKECGAEPAPGRLPGASRRLSDFKS